MTKDKMAMKTRNLRRLTNDNKTFAQNWVMDIQLTHTFKKYLHVVTGFNVKGIVIDSTNMCLVIQGEIYL